MVIVDTSAMIDFLKGKKSKSTSDLEYIIENNIPYGICTLVYQELLQGTSGKKDFNLLKSYLDTLEFYHPVNGNETHASAALIYLKCRQKGIIIRSSNDCLIARIAIEHSLKLLHSDKDFVNMKKVIRVLDLY